MSLLIPRGHTLDQVITDSALTNNLQVYDLGVSDQKVVSMDLTFLSPATKLKCEMYFQSCKSTERAIMTINLEQITYQVSDLVDELVALCIFVQCLCTV